MNLQKLKKSAYDLIVSLGQNCDPAGHLRRRFKKIFNASGLGHLQLSYQCKQVIGK